MTEPPPMSPAAKTTFSGFWYVTAKDQDGKTIIEEYRVEENARYAVDFLEARGYQIQPIEWEA
jgi:hypothetical protein